MNPISKGRVVLAILGIVFLLVNPAGICAGTPSAQPASNASHPCCPPPAGSGHSQSSGSCVCIDRQPATPILPTLADSGLWTPVAVAAALGNPDELRSEKVNAPGDVGVIAGNRFITFHQILV